MSFWGTGVQGTGYRVEGKKYKVQNKGFRLLNIGVYKKRKANVFFAKYQQQGFSYKVPKKPTARVFLQSNKSTNSKDAKFQQVALFRTRRTLCFLLCSNK